MNIDLRSRLFELGDTAALAWAGEELGIEEPLAKMSAEDKKAARTLVECTRDDRKLEQLEAMKQQILNHKIRMDPPLLLNAQELEDIKRCR
jgi:hypothetical protein